LKKNSPLKSIVFLIPDIHFGGGGERVAINLANYFNKIGYKVEILSLMRQGFDNIYHINNNISINYLGLEFDKGKNFINKFKSFLVVRKYFRSYTNPIIAMGIGNYPSLLLSSLPKSEIVKTIGCQHLAYSGIKGIWAILRHLFFCRLDRVISLTNYDLPKYQKINNQTVVIPNALSIYPDKSSELTNKQLLFVGRMVYEKGYDLLLEIIKRVKERQPDWTFRIIGDGPLREVITNKIELLGLRKTISILASTNQIENEFLNSSIFLMTSRTEGLPMVLIEAQSCGLPAICFDCETGPSEIIDDQINGFLIECYDLQAMTEKILLLCQDKELRIQMGKNARKSIMKFAPESVHKKWKVLFEDLSAVPE
jgi:glycosyltransferase involved in cell wall biosynthesis